MKKRSIKKQWLWFGALFLACGLLTLLALLGLSKQANLLPHEHTAERWAQNGGWCHVNVYTAKEDAYSYNAVMSQHYKIIDELTAQSIEPDSEGANLLLTAYCGFTQTTVKVGKSTQPLSCVAVGGDFFYFHPMELVSGNYFDPDGLMNDFVILNETAAWKLFGATDAAGMEVTISGQPYTVVGVVREGQDDYTQTAYDLGGCIYLSHQRLRDVPITCVEMLLPNPVDDFGAGIVRKQAGESRTVVEVSDRFSLGELFDCLGTYTQARMKQTPIAYPYWENAAILAQGNASLILAIGLVPCAFCAVCLLALAFWLVRRAKKPLLALRGHIENQIEKQKSLRYQRRIEHEKNSAL